MRELFISGTNIVDAYHKALLALNERGNLENCNAYNTTQKECSMTIFIEHPLQEPMISKLCICSPESLEQYRQEMLNGILDFRIGNGWDYTYHSRMTDWQDNLNQIDFVIKELQKDPSSRRAVIDIRDNNKDAYSVDPACLQHIQYFIRDNKLDCCVLFRSNDLCRATFMNIFALVMLQKKIADELNLEIGTYTHRANSMHCYEASFKDLDNYCRAIKNKSKESLMYNYINDWDNKMLSCQKTIKLKIEELKGR